MELIRRPNEFTLLALISFRAKRTKSFSSFGLAPGEAFIGDCHSCGLTQQKYRTAKKNLERWGFITTRSTNRGTIARLVNSVVFDINMEEVNEQGGGQETSDQQAVNEQVTTNKNEKKRNNEKNERKHLPHPATGPQGSNFEKFWQAYPRKRSKGQAEKAWKSIKPDDALITKIISALEIARTSSDWLRDGGRYIPYPATWLRAKGWEDQQETQTLFARFSDTTRKNMRSVDDWEPNDER